ncbi:glycosyl hydrolases family 18 domain-containing protein [Hirsutella rhossiliensis]|uniref:chitinase n=1 Tax=Hirsutella rhossiliensis TaxID=111463 RepID=A0A9P8SFW4_9HYPO|nr:glycosyl hydrolases family 18 domain-containing protein [Hirsutella rhossiliensis]KAH0961186.1 glycosyl hydrolases family 18 domain-containing protein [Hirsutella rhossiliensis]
MQAVVGLASPSQPADALEKRSGASYVNMVYWPYWANKELRDVDAADISHIMYAFGKVLPDGTVEQREPVADVGSTTQTENAGGKWAQLFLFKQANPHVKTVLSIGGWPKDEEKAWFASAASTVESRERFVETATQLMLDGGFDGLDIDWEYPVGAKESKDHAELLKALRQKLDGLKESYSGYHFLLTLATSASSWWHSHLSFDDLIPVLDFWYIMAYDYTGSWGDVLLHNANLFRSKKNPNGTQMSTDEGIEALKTKGISASKMVLGLPSYAQVFRDLLQPGDKKTTRNFVASESLKDMKLDEFDITCDDEATIATKAQYVKDKGLAGTFMWDVNHDLPGKNALYVAAAKALGQLDRSRSCQEYPDSRYANIRGQAKPKTTASTTTASTSKASSATSKQMTTSTAPNSSSARILTSSSSALASSGNQWGNKTTPALPRLSSSSSSVVPTSSLMASSASSASSASDETVSSSASSGTQSSHAATRTSVTVPCALCNLPDYMIPAINADGMVVKTVFVIVIKQITVACPDKAACAGPSAVTLTQSVFTTVCPIDASPATPTVDVAPDAGVEPISVSVAGRVVAMCATELGCHATDAAPTSGPGRTDSRSGKAHSSGPNGHLPGGSDGQTSDKLAEPARVDIQAKVDVQAKVNGQSGASGAGKEGEHNHQKHPGSQPPVGGSASGAGRLSGSKPTLSCTPRPSHPVSAQASSEAALRVSPQSNPEAGHGVSAQADLEVNYRVSPHSNPEAGHGVSAQADSEVNYRVSPHSNPEAGHGVSAQADSEVNYRVSPHSNPEAGHGVSAQADSEANYRVSPQSNPGAGHRSSTNAEANHRVPAQSNPEVNHGVSLMVDSEAAQRVSPQPHPEAANRASTQSSPVAGAESIHRLPNSANTTAIQRVASAAAPSGALPVDGQAKAVLTAGAAQTFVSAWAALAVFAMLF